MSKRLEYEQILVGNDRQYQELISMWIPYMREIFKDDEETQNESDVDLEKYALQRVNIQGKRNDMHFELVYLDKTVIGFAFYAVDLGGIKGIVEAGYGYIMEYYIIPSKRRSGYATELYQHVFETLKNHKVDYIYLTPDNESGIPFWLKIGFSDTGKVDPDNKMPIYIKKCNPLTSERIVKLRNNMGKMEFIVINSNNSEECLDFMRLGYAYMKETASDYSLQIHEKFLNSIINKQHENTRWLVLLKVDGISIGFVHAKIDKDEKIEYGYIMEFYIHPAYRKKGLGTDLYDFIKKKFIDYGIKDIWLTANKITGEPFWFSLGFIDTGEIENELKVLKIKI